MKTDDLILRCYAERKGKLWQAFCIDLNLAVQGDSFPQVKDKIHQQIGIYLYDALVGEDKPFAGQLLSRKSPLRFRLKYHYYKSLCRIDGAKKDICRIFDDTLPMAPTYQGA